VQPESQNRREPEPEDQSDALQEPQVVLMGVLGLARPADLGENMHRGHIEERPGREEHPHTCRTELVLSRTAGLWTHTHQIKKMPTHQLTIRDKTSDVFFLTACNMK